MPQFDAYESQEFPMKVSAFEASTKTATSANDGIMIGNPTPRTWEGSDERVHHYLLYLGRVHSRVRARLHILLVSTVVT